MSKNWIFPVAYRSLLTPNATEVAIQRIKEYFQAQLSVALNLHRVTAPIMVKSGIGQSRLSLFLLRKAHIGEVQAGIWPEKMVEQCYQHNIHLF